MRKATPVFVLACAGLLWSALGRGESDAADEPATEGGEKTLRERVREILTTTADEGEDGNAVRCIRSSDYRRVQILDSQRLVFHGRRGKRWLNQLRMPCPGLRRNDTLSFQVRSSRICDQDGFRSIDPTGYGGPRSGTCGLGKFEPISQEQVKMLEDALRAERQSRRSSG